MENENKYFFTLHKFSYQEYEVWRQLCKFENYDTGITGYTVNQLVIGADKEAKLTTTVPFGKVMVDGLGVGDVGNIVLRDRQKLSQDGLIIIVLTMSKNGKVVAGPDVITRGFVYVRESENLIEDIKKILRQELDKCEEKNITDWASIKLILRDSLHDYVYKKTKRLPMILPIIMEV